MILEFSIENYRSFKDKCTLSMVAESSKSKPDNVFEHTMANGDTVRLLKSAVLYGANASGKTTVLKALQALRKMSISLGSAGDVITQYNPFLFDNQTKESPTKFSLSFIGPSNFKYVYKTEFNSIEILSESLDYYPKSQVRNLFSRVGSENQMGVIHQVKMGQDSSIKSLKVFQNQTVLSKFGTDEPDEFFTPIFLYMKEAISITGNIDITRHKAFIESKVYKSPDLLKRLSNLIKIADTKIEGLSIKKDDDAASMSGSTIPRQSFNRQSYNTFGKHAVYENNERVADSELPMNEESKGTNMLFILGAHILDKLDKGGVFLVDEIDTSLHPMLAKFLVMLFQHPHSNPHNAQLIFTTHETTFLDKDIFRKDQIWFTEKNEYGASELVSVQEFDKVREDTPFEKWYLAGKFGGIPNIREIEFIFQDDEA